MARFTLMLAAFARTTLESTCMERWPSKVEIDVIQPAQFDLETPPTGYDNCLGQKRQLMAMGVDAALKALIRRSPLGTLLRRLRRARFDPQARSREYDRQTIEIMKQRLSRTATCVDVGAHRGKLLRAMVDIAPEGRHFAFEPLPDFAAGLRREFPNVSVHECALAERAGESTFEYVVNSPAYSGLRRRIYDRPEPVIEQIHVRVETLDGVIPPDFVLDFVKIDVEGGELGVLRGGRETLRRSHPVVVFEAGKNSTGQYGVTPRELFRFVRDDLDMRLSTLRSWLRQGRPYDERSFTRNWERGPEFYFVAYPMRGAQ